MGRSFISKIIKILVLFLFNLCSKDNNERYCYGVELMDLIHAVETALRIEFSDKEVEELRNKTEQKNRDRGYYAN